MVQLLPMVWRPARKGGAASDVAPTPNFRSITIMLTEFCNLDCWMCDFAKSKGLREAIGWSPERYIDFLTHPYFNSLNSIGFTGGEPFAYAGVKELYGALQDRFPSMFISFSSNATLYKPMSETFELTRKWKNTKLFTSIDGVETHDVQRGKVGAFNTSMTHLSRLRERFPELGIDIKFTVTPVNYEELRAAYTYCTERGFNFTAKMIENNPYYTNVLSSESRDQEFSLNETQLQSVRTQLDWILDRAGNSVSESRLRELHELRDSLDPAWRRSGACTAPTQAAFLDARMNFFCCKEYPPVLNLNVATLDEVPESAVYRDVIAAEKANSGACSRCTSQLKSGKSKGAWARWLA
jgi:sulfatase maturation enzyme AslB (radical SAM superfamily)